MAEIPWWAWLGVGLFVSISSAMSGANLTLFAWVGLVFVVIGIGKVIVLFILSPRETKQEQQIIRQPQEQWQYQPGIMCPRCRVGITSQDRFCRYCGLRLR